MAAGSSSGACRWLRQDRHRIPDQKFACPLHLSSSSSSSMAFAPPDAVDGFLAGETSGTTVTLAVVDGLTVTVASVGDSRCILDSQGGVVSELTVDHRLEENPEERERVTACGGEVGRLNICGRREVCPEQTGMEVR